MSRILSDNNYSAQQRAYRYIRDRIMSGDLAGGQKLKPGHIAELLNISRMPVREALLQLDAEGLVTARPNTSAVVTSLTAEEVEELFEMRAALEALAIVTALPNLRPESFLELETLLQRMSNASGDRRQWVMRHGEFHDYLCQLSGRPRLAGQIQSLRNAVQPYLLMYVSHYQSPEIEGSEHEALLAAIRTGNSLLVESVVRDHIMKAGRGVIRFLRAQRSEKLPWSPPEW